MNSLYFFIAITQFARISPVATPLGDVPRSNINDGSKQQPKISHIPTDTLVRRHTSPASPVLSFLSHQHRPIYPSSRLEPWLSGDHDDCVCLLIATSNTSLGILFRDPSSLDSPYVKMLQRLRISKC
jgi:hypothetical protein